MKPLVPKIVGLILLTLVTPSSAYGDDWSREDTYREVAWMTLLAVDYSQTMYIAKHPEDVHENNPILGNHPSTKTVRAYMISAAIIHPIISYLLPPKYREWWQYGTIAIEVGAVGINASAGIGFAF